jgi:Secretion system C-terminal sorting domain
MKKNTIFFACLACLSISSGLQAQYRWHIVLPDHSDTIYRGITSISCSGESCTAEELISPPNKADSNVILQSSDGGLDWTAIGGLPQYVYDTSGEWASLVFDAVQQIDSLDAIAADMEAAVIVRTYDGWKTWSADSSLIDSYFDGFSVNPPDVYGLDFANAAEGMLNEGFSFYLSTTDSGKHWTEIHFPGASSYHSYGSGMFRVFKAPGTIFATHDGWNTIDTTPIAMNGPLLDTGFHAGELVFGNGDTLAITGNRLDSADFYSSTAMALSTDFGLHWTELPLPRNNGIYLSGGLLPRLNWDHIALAAEDSVGRILMGSNHGASWELDTVPLDNGASYFNVECLAVTDSGRVIASIQPDSDSLGSSDLVYLEPNPPAGVETWERVVNGTYLYPNPASSVLNISSVISNSPVHIYSVLGQEVLHGILSSSGNVSFEVSSLTDGIYLVQLEIGEALVPVGKLLIVK